MVYSCRRSRLVFSHILPTDLCVCGGGGGGGGGLVGGGWGGGREVGVGLRNG